MSKARLFWLFSSKFQKVSLDFIKANNCPQNFTKISQSLLTFQIMLLKMRVWGKLIFLLCIILRIVGDGPQKENSKNLVKELNLQDYVVFNGFIKSNEIQNYYKNAHIFLNMSRSEGFATICLEAMSSGLAIISSKVGGFSDAITDGIDGYLVEQEDYTSLSKRIIELIRNSDLIFKFGRKARRKTEQKYDWGTIIIPKYREVYNMVLANNYE